MVDPEQCATYYSMTTGEQHLKDSGYGDILAQENNDNEDLKMGPMAHHQVQDIPGHPLLQTGRHR